jgi:DNA-directed RNA polymerase
MCKSIVQQQIELESRSIDDGIKKYRNMRAEGRPMPPDFMLMKKCLEPLKNAIEEYRDSKKKGQLRHVKTELAKMPAIEAAYITISTLVFNANCMGQPIQSFAGKIGDAIKEHINFKNFEREAPGYLRSIEQSLKTSNSQHRRKVIKSSQTRLGTTKENWSLQHGHDVGLRLIYLLIESTGIVKRIPGQTCNHNSCVTLDWHPDVEHWIAESHKRCELMNPKYMPMIAPPVDWNSTSGGGYYTLHLDLIKNKWRAQHRMREPDQQVYDALNRLQRTKWQINKEILSFAQELVNQEGTRLGVLASEENVVFPDRPYEDNDMFEDWKQNNPEDFTFWKKRMTTAYNQVESEKSKFLTQSLIVATARKMSDYCKIYFPWVLDFRGRAYPVATYLSPQGEDLSKGLLRFANGIKLGKHGAFWLAIHGANCFGNDKVSLQSRYDWVIQNEKNIIDSGERPLDGNRFWIEAEKPWQFLAFCLEWATFVRAGRKPDFRSKLCVSVDGSCNGLQHFSALLRDEEGARVTNLKALPERYDIYSTIAEQVAEDVHQDAKEGNWIAQLWDGRIDRKTVKRNVMTVPYGVTKRGMSDQIVEEIKHTHDPQYKDLQVESYKAGSYLGGKVYDAIRDTVFSAIVGMEWFKNCARVFNDCGQPIEWITPVGMHVYMHKLKTQTKRIKTQAGDAKVYLSLKYSTDKLNPTKQTNGISPNVIHSFDGAHLMKTVNACFEKHKITDFGMVHDSFGCHAANMNAMYHQLRKQFVDMYERDLMNDIREQWIAQLPENYAAKIPPVPKYGSFNINQVLTSEYFFA